MYFIIYIKYISNIKLFVQYIILNVKICFRNGHLLQVVEGEVDVLGLSEQLPIQASLANSIRSSQVHQMELGAPQGGRARLTPAQVHSENTVGTCGCLVHWSLEMREW